MVLLAVLSGCGGDGKTAVSGTVSWEGKPIANGMIEFAPQDGKTATAAGIIANGSYSVRVPQGEKIVRLSAFVEAGRRHVVDKATNVDTYVTDTKQILPPNLNVKSTISCTIKGSRQTYNYPE